MAEGQERPTAPELEGARVLHGEVAVDEVRRLRAEADSLAAGLEGSRSAELDLLGELTRLDAERSVAEKRARAATIEAAEARRVAATASERAMSLAARHAATRRRVGLVLEALYREGERPEWRRWLAGLEGEAGDGAEGIAVVAALRHAELGRDLEAAARAAADAHEEAEERRVQHEQALAKESAAVEELLRRRRLRTGRLAAIRAESGRLGAELARAEAALQDLLAGRVPEGSFAPGSSVAPLRLIDLDQRRGGLPWPIDAGGRGRLLERFGEVVHARHGTRTRRHGIVIEASEGTPIRAVAAGRVVFRDWYKGFGLSLVLDHGHGFLSVVAHAQELHVRSGEAVEEGQVVGTVGDTGSLEGPRLYFQLQRRSEPVDPLAWLEP